MKPDHGHSPVSVFEWDRPLYPSCRPDLEAGLLDARLNPHPTSRLGSALRRALGFSWKDILHGQDLELHYTRLRHLATPRPIRGNRFTYFATSSPGPSSQTQPETHYEAQSNASLRSSPPPPSTPHGASRTCTSLLRDHRLGAPLSYRDSSPLPSTPSRDISTTPRCASVEKNIRTPHQNSAKGRGHTMVVTPACDHNAAAIWAGSCTMDSTYKSTFTPSSATEITEDKHEADLEYTAKACLDAVRDVIESLCPSRQLRVNVETPDTLYIVVEWYRCSCNRDHIRRTLTC